MQEVYNEIILKVSGGVPIDFDLAVDDVKTITGEITVFSAEKRSNNDGTYNRVLKCKFTGPVSMI